MSSSSYSAKQSFLAADTLKTAKLLGTASIAALSFAMASEAKAQCVTTGNDTECTGTTTGQQNVVGDDQTVTVVAGATVNSTDPRAFQIIGNRNTFTNEGDVALNAAGQAVRMESSNGPITFSNTGNILGRVDSATGVVIFATGGNVVVDNSGSIIAQGPLSGTGLIARATNGDVAISNSGTISNASGFSAISASSTGGTVTIDNSGMVSSGGVGIEVGATGDVDVVNSGDINAGFAGINVSSSSGLTRIDNQGDIASQNLGIRSFMSGTASTEVVNSGSITTTGALSDAIAAIADTGTINLTNSAGGTIVTNRNALRGDSDGDVDLTNEGTITVTGLGAGLASNTDGNITHTNRGSITTTGDGSRGFSANTGGDAILLNEGDITVSGDGSGTRGMSNRMLGTGDSQIINAAGGTVTVTGDDTIGVFNQAGSGTTLVQNDGAIDVAGAGSTGIFAIGDGVTIENSGSIAATNSSRAAIELSLQGGTPQNAITNTGTISSDGFGILVVGSSGETLAIDSAGTISGSSIAIRTFTTTDNVAISGTINGAILLEDFDDTLTYNGDGTGGFGGRIDGGTGNDTLTFSSTGAFSFDQTASNFETVNVDGFLTLDGATFSDGGTFTVDPTGDLRITTNGATIDAPGGFVNNGTLGLVPDANLTIIDGGFSALSGSTTIFGVDAATPQITADGAIDFAAGSQIEIDVLDFNTLVNGRSFDAAISGTSVTDNSNDIIDNSMLFDFSSEIIGGNILRINVNQVLMIPDAVDPNDATALGAATGLQALVDAGDVTLSTLFGQLPDDASVANGVEQFIAGDSGGVVDNAHFTMAAVSNVVQDRLQFLPGAKNADSDAPKSAFSIWGNAVFGGHSGDADGFAAAYDGSISGFVIGSDIAFGGSKANAIIGGGYYNLDGDVDEFTVAPNASDLKSSGGIVYVKIGSGGFKAYLQGAVGTVDVAGQRQNSLTGGAVTSAYSGDQTSFTAMIEYAFPVGTWSLTPRAEFLSVGTDFDSYTEQAALGALEIGGLESDLTRGKFELEAATSWQAGSGFSIVPDIRASVATTSRSDDALTAQFVQGGSAFRIALGDRDGTSAGIGAGLSVVTDAGVNFRVSYDGEFGDGYDQHIGHVTAQIRF